MKTSQFLNVGRADRMLRAVLGVIALALVFNGPRSPWGYVGLLLLLTATVGFCPLYALLGLSTRHESRA